MSDSDKMRAEFEKWAKAEGMDTATITFFSCGQHTHYIRPETAIAFRAYQAGRKAEREEVERLRDELAEKKAENVDWEEAYDRLKAELAAAKAEVQEQKDDAYCWMMVAQDKERELTAAKAASVVPVKEVQTAFDKWLEYECWECHRSICEVTWKAAIKWMKERGEG